MKKDSKKSFKSAFALARGILAGFVALTALFMIWGGGLEMIEVLGLTLLCASSMALFLNSINRQNKTTCNTTIPAS